MSIYLYVKTHRKTGLKYLGKTNAKDPYKYTGSGIYWTRHLKEHGYDFDTKILHECESNDEIRDLGIFYSNLWDIVNATDSSGRKIWANLKCEEGDGGWGGEQNPNNLSHVKEYSRQRFTVNNPMHIPEIKEKSRENTIKAMKDPIIRDRLLNGIHSESWMQSRKNRIGNKAPCFDHSIYTFKHKDGTVIKCTQYELSKTYQANASKLVNKKLKTSKGWSLIE